MKVPASKLVRNIRYEWTMLYSEGLNANARDNENNNRPSTKFVNVKRIYEKKVDTFSD